jgi:hypothetical protein
LFKVLKYSFVVLCFNYSRYGTDGAVLYIEL